MGNGKTFLGGLPTGPDVNALFDAYPDLKAGDVIPNEQIEQIIRAKWKTPRFRTVVDAYRKKLLKDHNIDVRALPGEGLQVLAEAERVTESIGGFRKAVRGVRRSAGRAALVKIEKLTPEEQRRADFARRQMEATYAAAAKTQRDIAETYQAPLQLPRVRSVK